MTGIATDRYACPKGLQGVTLSWRCESRRRIGHCVHGEYFVSDRMARDIEPPAAAIGVAPALEVQTLGVVAKEQIIPPGRIALLQARPHHVRGTAAGELAFI